MVRGVPESLKVFYGFDEYPLERMPEHVFSAAATQLLSDRDWYELINRAVDELENLDARYVRERQAHDSVELAERHGNVRALLATASSAGERVINPEAIEAIRDDDRFRDVLSELYLSKRTSLMVDDLARTLELTPDELRKTAEVLHHADFVRVIGGLVSITPRGETVLERALSLS